MDATSVVPFAKPATQQPQPAILVRGLGVRYDLHLQKRLTVQQTIEGVLRRNRDRSVYWAVRGVDVEVGVGETLGIIGRNGAGKSTLMLVLAGILEPDEGFVETRGRISALLAVGAGFDPQLSGAENIELALAFAGIDGAPARELTPEIIEFADLGQFIDAPLRTYSTGMRARLGFAVATAIEPDILIIDEVLSTGDQDFRARSRERIDELVGGAHAAVIVTHDLPYVAEQCTRALWLEKGRVAAVGDPRMVVEAYRKATAAMVRSAQTA